MQNVVDDTESNDPVKVGEAFKKAHGISFEDHRKAAKLPAKRKLVHYIHKTEDAASSAKRTEKMSQVRQQR